jgi:hypothetical protein
MELFTTTLLSLALGLTIGIRIKWVKRKREETFPRYDQPNEMHYIVPYNSHGLKPYFDTIEIRFLKRILQNDEKQLSVIEANEILRIEKLSKENQRQRRHLFLKDLNVKLKMIFKIPECIERISTEADRRSKYYCLHSQIKKETIEELLIEDVNKPLFTV